jgi:hypothetical protein
MMTFCWLPPESCVMLPPARPRTSNSSRRSVARRLIAERRTIPKRETASRSSIAAFAATFIAGKIPCDLRSAGT